LRFALFDSLSIKTMRYVQSVPRKFAKEIVREIYTIIAENFFFKGSLTRQCVVWHSMTTWRGERIPMVRRWVESEIAALNDHDRPIARRALVLAKAPCQVDAGLVDAATGTGDQTTFIRTRARCSYVGKKSAEGSFRAPPPASRRGNTQSPAWSER
jgi:hypothetical protein